MMKTLPKLNSGGFLKRFLGLVYILALFGYVFYSNGYFDLLSEKMKEKNIRIGWSTKGENKASDASKASELSKSGVTIVVKDGKLVTEMKVLEDYQKAKESGVFNYKFVDGKGKNIDLKIAVRMAELEAEKYEPKEKPGDREYIWELRGSNKNYVTLKGHNWFHRLAIANRGFPIARYGRQLIKLVNQRDDTGATPLCLAIKHKSQEAVFAILSLPGVNFRSGDKKGNTVLHYAAEAGNLLMAKKSLDRGLSPNIRSGSGMSPLMVAAANGRLDVFLLLLENGGDPYAKNQKGYNCFHFAAFNPKLRPILDMFKK